MAFPTNPITGQTYSPGNGNKTWYWTGTSWSLLPPVVAQDGSDHEHDTPKILDDLLDVEVKEPAFSEQHDYYINGEDPNVSDGWGRFRCDTEKKEITYNKYDLNGKDFKDIYDFTNTTDTTHRFAAFDESWTSESKVIGLEENSHSYTIRYENNATVQLINNAGNSKLFGITAADYKQLAEGAILVYRRERDLWGPEPNPTVEAGAKVHIGPTAPEFPAVGDIWVHDTNYYMYIWDGNAWFALTGADSGIGGDIANNPTIKFISSRGLSFNGGSSVAQFRLNQIDDQNIDLVNNNITTIGTVVPEEGTAKEGDMFILKPDYNMYVYTDDRWVGLTGEDVLNPKAENRLEQPCTLYGGKPNSVFCTGGDTRLPSPAVISTTPPAVPSAGDLWYDSEHLELRVWYVTDNSPGYWVSATHPGMRPDLRDEDMPDAISVTGPPVAQELTETRPYRAKIGWDILANPDNKGVFVKWYCPEDAGFRVVDAYDQERFTEVTCKFSKFGNMNVFGEITYKDTDGVQRIAADSVFTMVTMMSPDEPIRYNVTVEESSAGPVFAIDGEVQPPIYLMRNRKYIFDQSHPSNRGYLFRFYNATEYTGSNLNDNIGLEYTKGIEQVRTDVIFTVPFDAPIRLAYGSPNPDVLNDMGFWAYPFDADGSFNIDIGAIPTPP